MKKFLSVFMTILGWVFTAFCILALVFAIFSFVNSKKTGEPTTILGYRPVYVLTGSMEPTMRTDSIVITKKIEDLSDLEVGDIVTYHIEEDGKMLVITHRIVEISDEGEIRTRGDNNNVYDANPITIDNVEAKVVLRCNWVANIIHMWGTTKGKIIICSIIVGIILLFYALSTLIGQDDDDEDDTKKITENDETSTKESAKDNDTKDSEATNPDTEAKPTEAAIVVETKPSETVTPNESKPSEPKTMEDLEDAKTKEPVTASEEKPAETVTTDEANSEKATTYEVKPIETGSVAETKADSNTDTELDPVVETAESAAEKKKPATTTETSEVSSKTKESVTEPNVSETIESVASETGARQQQKNK